MKVEIEDKKFYGTTTVGEKGQIVLPAQLRKDMDIKAGEKLSVLVFGKMGCQGIVVVKSNILTFIIEKIFGGKLEGWDKK